MSPSFLVLLSVGLGIVVGVLAVGSVVAARALGRRRVDAMNPEIPDAAIAILEGHRGFGAILDASLTPVYANRAAKEHETITGEMLRAPEFLGRAREVLASGTTFTDDAEGEGGAAIWLRVLRLGDRFLVVLAEDRGEEQRVNAMRRDFITNISHELKTPISAIGLLSEAVQEAADDPAMVRTFSKKLMKESRRLGELARDIIRLSEAQATLLPEQRESVDLRALVKEKVDEHRILAGERRVELVVTETTPSAHSSDVIRGRPGALGIAIANLLSNAIEHSPPGGRVGVGMEREGGALVVTVTDQGEGIAAEYLPRVFERFFRIDDGRTRDEGGTGLGLSIVRHTLRSHGGDADVWSQPGVGSSFSLTFPLEGARDEAKAKRAKQTKKAAKAARKVVTGARRDTAIAPGTDSRPSLSILPPGPPGPPDPTHKTGSDA